MFGETIIAKGRWTIIAETKLRCVLKLVSVPCCYFIPKYNRSNILYFDNFTEYLVDVDADVHQKCNKGHKIKTQGETSIHRANIKVDNTNS